MKTPILTFFALFICFQNYGQAIMVLKSSGKVVIGDTTQISTPGSYNLYVQNGILTERVKVSLKTTSEWSDGAFSSTPSMENVAESIEKNQHLVDMPSAGQLVKEGYELKEMDARLLQQIEWLWQHMIRMEAENKALKEEVNQLKTGKSSDNK